MPDVSLRLACIDYLDRTRPLIDGQVEVSGVDLTCVPLPPLELGARWTEFDVAETIVPVYMGRRSRGDDSFIAIPVFPYRAFFLSSIVVNVDSGIERPEDLAGKRVATPGLHLAGTLWLRGILQDRFGVEGSQLRWVMSGQPELEPPPDMQLEIVPPEPSLSAMLEQGEVDAWIGSNPPPCFLHGSPRVRRLFPNYRQVEEEYARESGIFPIIHAMVVRQDLYERHRWLASALVEAFERARQIGLERLVNNTVYAVGLPWLRQDLEELPRLFGGDWYRYGYEPNRAILETMARYAAEQGVTHERLNVAELFAPETRG